MKRGHASRQESLASPISDSLLIRTFGEFCFEKKDGKLRKPGQTGTTGKELVWLRANPDVHWAGPSYY
jgi:hypothetical protein